ncbi:MAG: hypothetical protein WD073_03585 [Xanthobacteraceae bacterium]
MTKKGSPEADAADRFGEKKPATRSVTDGELSGAEACDAVSEAGEEDEPKIRSVEQPAVRPASANAARAMPQR